MRFSLLSFYSSRNFVNGGRGYSEFYGFLGFSQHSCRRIFNSAFGSIFCHEKSFRFRHSSVLQFLRRFHDSSDIRKNRLSHGLASNRFKFQFSWKSFRKSTRCFYGVICFGIIFAFGGVYFCIEKWKFIWVTAASNFPEIVLLSCGSFNPPTVMHLRMFELARDYLHKRTNFRAVEGIISPVHHGYGKKGLIATEHRIAMLRLAAKDSNWMRIDDWEAKQPMYCRTVVVLRHTREETSRRVMLLCGADLLKSFNIPNVWKPEDMEEILRDFGIVVITRSGTDLSEVIAQSPLLSKYKDNIHVVTERISNEISSTKVRQALADGESVRYIVPDGTLAYIYQHGLYGSDNRRTFDYRIS